MGGKKVIGQFAAMVHSYYIETITSVSRQQVAATYIPSLQHYLEEKECLATRDDFQYYNMIDISFNFFHTILRVKNF